MKLGVIQEMIQDYHNGVYDYTKNGECSQCGNCCTRYLALSNKEINTIRAYMKRHNIKQQKHAVNVYASPLFDATCPFLDDTKKTHKCTIYDVRPLICKDFICIKDKKPTIELYKEPRRAVDMTELFFGNEG